MVNGQTQNHWTDEARTAAVMARKSKNALSKKAMELTDKAGGTERKHLEAAQAHRDAAADHLDKGHFDLARAHETLAEGHDRGAARFAGITNGTHNGKACNCGGTCMSCKTMNADGLPREEDETDVEAREGHPGIKQTTKDSGTANANGPRHGDTGRFQGPGAGTGKGPVHAAAVAGASHGTALTDDDARLGEDAARQAKLGHNPPSWAVDEDKWEKAKTAAKGGSWALVSHIYQNMGGKIKGKTQNAWTDEARQAAAEARKATAKAVAGEDSDHDKQVAFHARMADEHAAAGRDNQAVASHAHAAMAHQDAAEFHADKNTSQLHLAAAAAHRKVVTKAMANNARTPAEEGLHGMDGDNNADDYHAQLPNTTGESQDYDDVSEPIGDEDEEVGQGDRPPDPGKLKRMTGKSKKDIGDAKDAVGNALWAIYNRDWPQAKRDQLDKEDFAGPDQSFPIKTQEDLDAAVHSIGRAKDPAAVKAGIKRIAKRKGLKLPDTETWNAFGEQTMPMPQDQGHDASTHALGASAALDSEEAQGHAKAAQAKAAKGDSIGAAIAHLKAAKAHEDEADDSKKDDPHAMAAALHKKAAAMHSMTENQTHEEDSMSRKLLINKLTANVADEQDRQTLALTLGGLETATLRTVVRNAKKSKDDDDDDDDDDTENDGTGGKAEGSNADVAGGTGSIQVGGAGTADEYPKMGQPGAAGVGAPKATGNAKLAWNSIEEMENDARLPSEFRAIITNGKQQEARLRQALTAQLVANVADAKQREELSKDYLAMNSAQLQKELTKLRLLMPQRQQVSQPTLTSNAAELLGDIAFLSSPGDAPVVNNSLTAEQGTWSPDPTDWGVDADGDSCAWQGKGGKVSA